MKLLRIILPLLVTSFCFGLNACTDDSKNSVPVVGARYRNLDHTNFEWYFDISIEKESYSDDSTNEYKYHLLVTPNDSRIKVINDVTASIRVTFTYKLEEEMGTNAAHFLEQSVDINYIVGDSATTSSLYTATFDRPINEYPYFEESYSVTSASGRLGLYF